MASGTPTKLKRAKKHERTEIDPRLLSRIHQGDCVAGMQQLPDACIDLVFADPPFNIGYSYDVYHDRLEAEQYLDWSHHWMTEVLRVLKPSGSFWLAIGDEYAAELKVTAAEIGFRCRSWVVWYYTFGVHCKNKFTRSHAHLFHFIKDAEQFKFRNETVRVPSARQLVYGDARANSAGRMPDDTWILRPQDLVDGFTPSEDVWYFPRVAGTFKERAGFHGCQMPEQLLGRIIRCSSDEGDVVMDPFSGSSTTAAVAKKLNRRWLSFELSEEYVALGTQRLDAIAVGDPLDGSAEPKVSAPATVNGKTLADSSAPSTELASAEPPDGRSKKGSRRSSNAAGVTLPRHDRAFGFRQGFFDFEDLIDQDQPLIEAFAQACDGHSLDRVLADPVLHDDLQRACDRRAIPGTPAERNRRLFRLRGAGELKAAGVETQKRTQFSWAEQATYRFASEIAWRRLADEYPGRTLDELLCDPRTATQFDVWAARYCPGFRPLEYRWAALTLRRRLRLVRDASGNQTDAGATWPLLVTGTELGAGWESADWPAASEHLPAGPAVYAIGNGPAELTYIGESSELRATLTRMLAAEEQRQVWQADGVPLRLWYISLTDREHAPLSLQYPLVQQLKPRWNVLELGCWTP